VSLFSVSLFLSAYLSVSDFAFTIVVLYFVFDFNCHSLLASLCCNWFELTLNSIFDLLQFSKTAKQLQHKLFMYMLCHASQLVIIFRGNNQLSSKLGVISCHAPKVAKATTTQQLQLQQLQFSVNFAHHFCGLVIGYVCVCVSRLLAALLCD